MSASMVAHGLTAAALHAAYPRGHEPCSTPWRNTRGGTWNARATESCAWCDLQARRSERGRSSFKGELTRVLTEGTRFFEQLLRCPVCPGAAQDLQFLGAAVTASNVPAAKPGGASSLVEAVVSASRSYRLLAGGSRHSSADLAGWTGSSDGTSWPVPAGRLNQGVHLPGLPLLPQRRQGFPTAQGLKARALRSPQRRRPRVFT
jgi:hypothetical protein